MIFGIVTTSCNHQHYPIPEYFLHSPKETSYPLAIHLHFFCCPVPAYYQAPLCRFVYSGYFIHTDSYKTRLFVTDFFHPTNDLKVHLSVVLVLHFYGWIIFHCMVLYILSIYQLIEIWVFLFWLDGFTIKMGKLN